MYAIEVKPRVKIENVIGNCDYTVSDSDATMYEVECTPEQAAKFAQDKRVVYISAL